MSLLLIRWLGGRLESDRVFHNVLEGRIAGQQLQQRLDLGCRYPWRQKHGCQAVFGRLRDSERGGGRGVGSGDGRGLTGDRGGGAAARDHGAGWRGWVGLGG
jgi:hypothetical protein